MLINIANILFFITLIICVISKIIEIKDKTQKNDSFIFFKNYGNIFFIIMFILFSIGLIYRLESMPYEVHVDEAGAFYDAMCLSKYGVDRYLNKLPVYLINYGGGQSSLYAYFIAIIIKIFGTSIFSLRLPSVILSILAMIYLYKLVDENFTRKQALITVFIYTISPWNFMKSRWGLDCNLMSSIMIIAIYFFINAINTKRKYMFFISGFVWGIVLYSYVISYIVVPVVLGISILYMLITQKIKISNIICLAIPLVILAIPLIMMIAYNNNLISQNKYFCFSIPKLWFYRGTEISLSNVKENIKNIYDILFIKDFLNYNAIPEFGTLYSLSIPLVIFGIIEAIKDIINEIKEKEITPNLIIFLTFIVMFCLGLCLKEVNINKINVIYIPMIYFAGKFLSFISDYIKLGAIIVIILYCINASIFFTYYFTEFSNTDLKYCEFDIINASLKAENLQKDKIYVENSVNQTYIYTLIANPISPYEFNESLLIDNNSIVKYKNYYFYIPDDIDKNAVYVIKDNKEKIEKLQINNFHCEKYGEFCVLWKQ